MYLKEDGTVWAVGFNYNGQLGDGTTTNRSNPVQVVDGSGNPLSGVVGISAGYHHTVYLKGDGTVWWAVILMANWVTGPPPTAPGAGGGWIGQPAERGGGGLRESNHTVYLKGDGTVWAAGRNESGQLGDGATTNRSNPVQVVDGSGNPLSGVVGISAGNDHTVCLKVDGTVLAVGYNYNGQLGDGTTTGRTNPVQVLDESGNPLSGVVGIFAGSSSMVYLKGDGTVLAVGSNYNGQLGDGTATGRTNPVQVVDGSGNPLSGWWESPRDNITRCI